MVREALAKLSKRIFMYLMKMQLAEIYLSIRLGSLSQRMNKIQFEYIYCQLKLELHSSQ